MIKTKNRNIPPRGVGPGRSLLEVIGTLAPGSLFSSPGIYTSNPIMPTMAKTRRNKTQPHGRPLKHAEQLGLKFQRKFTNFIEKQRATICKREATNVRIEGTGYKKG
jgi:hypothetical protein